MSLEKIGHYALTNPASVYDEEALTALELAGRCGVKINECVEYVNQMDETNTKRLDNQDEKIKELWEAEIPEHITENVDRWLDEHPEATTTVQDGALTAEKMKNDFLQTIKNGYITPQMFGAKGDGVNDDTEAIRQAFNASEKGVVYFSKGEYLVTEPLVINRKAEFIGDGALIRCTSSDYLFKVSTYYREPFHLKGFDIICEKFLHSAMNNKVWGGCVNVEDCLVRNVKGDCIRLENNYNTNFKNLVLEPSSTDFSETLINIKGDSNNNFCNLLSFKNCSFTGKMSANLIDIDFAYTVLFDTCTFASFDIAINNSTNTSIQTINCWFEPGNICFNNSNVFCIRNWYAIINEVVNSASGRGARCPKTFYDYPNYAVEDISTGIVEMMNKPQFTIEENYITMLDEQGRNGGLQLYHLDNKKALFNVPLNTIVSKGSSSTCYTGLGSITKWNEGVLEVEVKYFRISNKTIVQTATFRGVLANGSYTEIDKTDSNAQYPATCQLNAANAMFTIGNSNGGTCIASLTVNRLTYEDILA